MLENQSESLQKQHNHHNLNLTDQEHIDKCQAAGFFLLTISPAAITSKYSSADLPSVDLINASTFLSEVVEAIASLKLLSKASLISLSIPFRKVI